MLLKPFQNCFFLFDTITKYTSHFIVTEEQSPGPSYTMLLYLQVFGIFQGSLSTPLQPFDFPQSCLWDLYSTIACLTFIQPPLGISLSQMCS